MCVRAMNCFVSLKYLWAVTLVGPSADIAVVLHILELSLPSEHVHMLLMAVDNIGEW